MEAFAVAILPGTTQLNVERLDRLGGEPCPQLLLDNLRAIIAADMFRNSVLGNQPAHDRAHFVGMDLTIHMDALALPSVFIEDGQQAQFTTAYRRDVHEIPRSYEIGMGRPRRVSGEGASYWTSSLMNSSYLSFIPR